MYFSPSRKIISLRIVENQSENHKCKGPAYRIPKIALQNLTSFIYSLRKCSEAQQIPEMEYQVSIQQQGLWFN